MHFMNSLFSLNQTCRCSPFPADNHTSTFALLSVMVLKCWTCCWNFLLTKWLLQVENFCDWSVVFQRVDDWFNNLKCAALMGALGLVRWDRMGVKMKGIWPSKPNFAATFLEFLHKTEVRWKCWYWFVAVGQGGTLSFTAHVPALHRPNTANKVCL